MSSKYNERSSKYTSHMYARKQMRDTLEGSIRVKNMGEMYLPMPSGWEDVEISSSKTRNQLMSKNGMSGADYLPWSHSNPAYRAYLHRARFPDMTANSLRMCIGTVTKYEPDIQLPDAMKYLVDESTNDGKSIYSLFAYLLSETLSVGKSCLVVDLDELTNQLYITTYVSEANIDWAYSKIYGQKFGLTMAKFVDGKIDEHTKDEIVLEYKYEEIDGVKKVVARKYIGDDDNPMPILLSYRGIEFQSLPVFFAGAFRNDAEHNGIPLMPISDISISIYQEEADLRQAHFMTCNPTLFIYGIGDNEKPTVLGSMVSVSLRNPAARAEYPSTDTSALDHILNYIKDLKTEAVAYGVALMSNPAKESGEALSIRQSNRGASLVHVVSCVGNAIQDALRFIAKTMGIDPSTVVFEPSLEFAEAILNAQDITALVSAWMNGAIDHNIVLDNIRQANYIKDGRTNDQIKNEISKEMPSIDPKLAEGADGNQDDKNDDKDLKNGSK